MSLKVIPVTLAEANYFVEQNHRHHTKVIGHKFSIGCHDGETLRGVAIVGRPVSRMRDDGFTLEVTRLCTDGVPNGCSMLYSAAWRAAKALGFTRLGTYILESEDGVSLRAAGWRVVHQTSGGSWSRPDRVRDDKHPLEAKTLWEAS